MADHYRGVIFETPLQNDIRYIQCSRLAHPTPALTSLVVDCNIRARGAPTLITFAA